MTTKPKRTLPPALAANCGKGRKPGTPNKRTAEAKAALSRCFEDIGGAAAFADWARKPANQGAFYALWTKLLPVEQRVAGSEETDAPVTVEHMVVFVREGRRITSG